MGQEVQSDQIMSEDMISRALEALRARIVSAERQREECDRVVAAARQEERLLLGLLALRRGDIAEAEGVTEIAIARDQTSTESKHPAIREAIEALAAAGRPLHISELMRLLRDRKVPIPGAGAQANLIAHLRRNAEVVRPSRGMYGLVAWGLEEMPPNARGKRRRRRMRVRVGGTNP